MADDAVESGSTNAKATEKNIDPTGDHKLVVTTGNSQPAPRDLLIATAVRFLQNPRVQTSPLSQKRAFLLKKGLTQGEIDRALDRLNMGTPTGTIGNAPVVSHTASSGQSEMQAVMPWQPGGPYNAMMGGPPPSLWLRWREFCSSMMVVGATFYGFYFLFKKYLEPALIGQKREEEDRLSRVERHLLELNKSLSQLKNTLVAVETSLLKQSAADNRRQIETDSDSQVQDIITLAEIKSEMASIKALLLSRKQFPASPATSNNIPSWQLEPTQKNNTETEKETQDETVPKETIQDSTEANKSVLNGVTVNGDSSEEL